MTKNMQQWIVRLMAVMTGAITALAVGNVGLLRLVQLLYDKVGITVVALAPLSIWGLWTAMHHSGNADLTLSYIGTTAQRIGLLGTVIGIVAATIRIGDSLTDGAAGAVSGALPAVGQALISTAVGFIIALGCDFVRYLQDRDNPQEIPNVKSTEEPV
jgi:hypothetical protein